MTMKRREFIGRMAAGSAVLSMPVFLSGCGVQRATAIADPTPENPFMEWFGVDEATTARVMAELTANGADAADLYFQHSRTNFLTLEDGIVSSASSTIEQGVGLRVVIGDQTGYAFTEDLGLASMLAAARTAAAIASGSQVAIPGNKINNTMPISMHIMNGKAPHSMVGNLTSGAILLIT